MVAVVVVAAVVAVVAVVAEAAVVAADNIFAVVEEEDAVNLVSVWKAVTLLVFAAESQEPDCRADLEHAGDELELVGG